MQTSKWPNRWESPEAKADRIGEGVAWAVLCVWPQSYKSRSLAIL